jgi:UDP-glucose 4-epimerase
VYGVPDATPIPESAPSRPINTYGATKVAFELALRSYRPALGLRSVSLRYFNVAGATSELGEDHRPETHLIPSMLRAIASGQPVTVFGDDYPTPDGTCVRDFVHVADLAGAHLAALEATAPGDPRTDEPLELNLGTSTGFSVRDVLAATERAIGQPVAYQVGPRREGDPPVLVADSARARELLGWEPRNATLDAMIGSAWEWHRRHPDGYAE